MGAPIVNIGIFSHKNISFLLDGRYHEKSSDTCCTGEMEVTYDNGEILFRGAHHKQLLFEAPSHDETFLLKNVTIGVNFHWERQEDQRFRGDLLLCVEGERIVAINRLSVEEYLLSVISSEMSATSSMELLKAHAVISRGWLMAQIEQKEQPEKSRQRQQATEERLIRWYDREDHTLFDVCADDHCQRYQGITRSSTPYVTEAVHATAGEVLTYDGHYCDTRFSKSCGGVTELFENCWEPVSHPYLRALRDDSDATLPDLTVEEAAAAWIRSTPEAFCHATDHSILKEVLNNYDRETVDFYRWQVAYSQQELSTLILQRSGIDFGEIIDLIPLLRGTSGRIIELKIIGTKKELIVGKELEIRRILSTSHLYSSAFVVDKEELVERIPQRFVLTGAGWGHGVGLCQIGAAVMGEKGYTYREILTHYFPGASLDKIY